MWTISLPLKVPVNKKQTKFFTINLNQYRNAHFQVLDKAKKTFTEQMKELLRGIPKLEGCSLEYILYPQTRQLCDVTNICSIEDKFFADSLVHYGILEDDNYKYIKDVKFRFGHIDKENPRVDVTIRRASQKEEDMKIQTKTTTLITFTQADLEEALKQYLTKHVEVAENAEISVFPLANGEFQIRLEQDTEATAKPAKAPKREKLDPKAAMAALKEKTAPVEEEEPAAVEEPSSVVGEGRGHTELPKGSLFAKLAKKDEEPVAEAASEEQETPPSAPKGKSLFGNFKRPSNV